MAKSIKLNNIICDGDESVWFAISDIRPNGRCRSSLLLFCETTHFSVSHFKLEIHSLILTQVD